MPTGVLRIALGLFLMAHGLIHASYGTPAPTRKPGAPEWPFVLTRSWILTPLGLPASITTSIGTVLWVLTAIGFVLAGLGFLGAPVLQGMWHVLTIGASITSLLLIVLFWHLWLVLGIAIDVALLIWVLRGS